MKEVKVRISDILHAEFYRLFPGHGERQAILLKIIQRIVDRAPKEQELIDDIIESLR